MSFTMHAAGLSDVGMKRQNNQDSYLINEKLGLFVVADGMGGHSGGEVASALAVKAGIPISEAGRSRLDSSLSSKRQHTHHAVDDAIEQAEIFANIFEWAGVHERTR